MIYFVGVQHELQTGKVNGAREFFEFLRQAISEYEITLVCEEWNEEATKKRGPSEVKQTIPSGVEFVQFDLDENERAPLGMKSDEQLFRESGLAGPHSAPFGELDKIMANKFEALEKAKRAEARKREPGWLNKLKPLIWDKNTIVIVGSDHISKTNPDGRFGFDTMLASSGLETEIIGNFEVTTKPPAVPSGTTEKG